MNASDYCAIPSNITTKFFILQKNYVHNTYMHQHVHTLFNTRTSYPRFSLRILRCDLQESVSVRFILRKFYDIPQGDRGTKFASWMYIFIFEASPIGNDDTINEVYNPDIVRVVRQFVLRRLYASSYWKNALYAEDLGVDREPGPLRSISPDLPAEEIEKRLVPFCDSALGTL